MAKESPDGWQMSTPVVLIIFNRPDTTKHVFAAIAKARPPKLLVIADGPREGRLDEQQKCQAARDIIDQVDWPCEVLTEYSDVNLGCKQRVSSGLDWAFSKVTEAIVLEDDCLPDPSFFRFCEEMLIRYRNDQRVGMITGNNFNSGIRRNEESYYFSKHVFIWGWATWADRWNDTYDIEMREWALLRDNGWLFDMLLRRGEVALWTKVFNAAANNKVDTWDTQWVFANWRSSRLSVIPNVNLVTNIGFGPEATHTKNENALANMPTSSIEFPLSHPASMIRNVAFDRNNFKLIYYRSFVRKVADRLLRLFGRL